MSRTFFPPDLRIRKRKNAQNSHRDCSLCDFRASSCLRFVVSQAIGEDNELRKNMQFIGTAAFFYRICLFSLMYLASIIKSPFTVMLLLSKASRRDLYSSIKLFTSSSNLLTASAEAYMMSEWISLRFRLVLHSTLIIVLAFILISFIFIVFCCFLLFCQFDWWCKDRVIDAHSKHKKQEKCTKSQKKVHTHKFFTHSYFAVCNKKDRYVQKKIFPQFMFYCFILYFLFLYSPSISSRPSSTSSLR